MKSLSRSGNDRARKQNGEVSAGKSLDDLPGALIFLVRVGADQIEVEPVRVGLGEEVTATGEVFQVEELAFFRRCTVSTSLWQV